ncbi:hypothetical protein [Streptomyces goshikiensis]
MDRYEGLLHGRLHGTDQDGPPPGALDGLLLDITGWTADEVQTGVAR